MENSQTGELDVQAAREQVYPEEMRRSEKMCEASRRGNWGNLEHMPGHGGGVLSRTLAWAAGWPVMVVAEAGDKQ